MRSGRNRSPCGDEELLEQYVEEGTVEEGRIPEPDLERKLFPCFFGSALKMTGVEEFVRGMQENMVLLAYPGIFGAKIYKIGRDVYNTKTTYMKITGGSLKVKTVLPTGQENQKDGGKRTGKRKWIRFGFIPVRSMN